MKKYLKLVACLAIILFIFAPLVNLVSGLPPLAAGTFPTGTFVVPMDDKQADRIHVYGFIHEFLRLGNVQVARIIEPPDVTMETVLTPSGTLYQGGPFLIEQKYSAQVNSLLADPNFAQVTVTQLTAPFTSNNIFFVRQAPRILVIRGIWGRTDITLSQMAINYTIVDPDVVLSDPSILTQYTLIVVDCPGWFGNPPSYSPARQTQVQAVYDTLRSHVQAGNEVIYTDIALKDLNATFSGYIQLSEPNPPGTWAATFYNPPGPPGTFSPEFPSQYYNPGPDPNSVDIVTPGSGYTVDGIQPAHTSDVRILMDSSQFGVPFRYTILGLYFQFGSGIVEGLALHPQDQVLGTPGYYAVAQSFGNKFVHGLQTDFIVTAAPPSVTIPQGQTAQCTVTVTSIGGFNSQVALQVTGNPPSSTPSISPSTVTPSPSGSVNSQLALATTLTTPTGTYNLTITGTSTLPAITRTTTCQVIVTPTSPDFVINANPSLLVVNVTQCGNYLISVKGVGDFNSAVNLTLTGPSTPATISIPIRSYRYTPNPVTPPVGGSVPSTLTVCAGSTTGDFTLTVSGTSGTLFHSTNVLLRVVKPVTPTPPINPLIFIIVLLLLLLALGLALLALVLSRKQAKPLRARPRVLRVLPLPIVRCRFCCRIMPLHSVYCPYCGQPQVVMVKGPPPSMAARRQAVRTGRSIIGFALTLVAGILVLLNSGALLSPGFYALWSGVFFWLPSIGQSYAFALGMIIGLVLIMGSIVMVLRHGVIADIIVFPFAVFALIIGGGFIAGMVLGIVGGIIGALKR
jgi:hypothetical protein